MARLVSVTDLKSMIGGMSNDFADGASVNGIMLRDSNGDPKLMSPDIFKNVIIGRPKRSVSSNTNISNNWRRELLTLTGATITAVTMPAPASSGDGWEIIIRNSSDNAVNLNAPTGGIDGETTIVMKPKDIRWVFSTGSVFTSISLGGGSGGGYTEASTAPTLPNVGDRWLDTSTRTEYTYIANGGNPTWVELAGLPAPDPTASQLLTLVKTVDGTGSGLDADLLGGQPASAYALASHPSTSISDSTAAGRAVLSAASYASISTLLRPTMDYPRLNINSSSRAITSSDAANTLVVSPTMLGGTWTINSSGMTAGWEIGIDGTTMDPLESLSIAVSGGKLIDGRTTIRVYPQESAFNIVYDGTNFHTRGRDRVVIVQSLSIAAGTTQIRSLAGFNDPEIKEIVHDMQDVYGNTTIGLTSQFLNASNVRITTGYTGKLFHAASTAFTIVAASGNVAASTLTWATTARMSGRLNLYQTSLAAGNWYWEWWMNTTAAGLIRGQGNYLKSSFNGGANPNGLDWFPTTGSISGGFVDVSLKR